MRKKLILAFFVAAVVVISATIVMSNTIIPQQDLKDKAVFVLSGWSYPDAYDQGIETIEVYENSSGSFSIVDSVFYYTSEAECTFDWEVGVAIRLDVYTRFNSTLTGVSSRTEGQNYQRHYVLVTDQTDTTIFSQQNFTYIYSDEEEYPIYFYGYRVTLNFLPVAGAIYTAEIMYEIYY